MSVDIGDDRTFRARDTDRHRRSEQHRAGIAARHDGLRLLMQRLRLRPRCQEAVGCLGESRIDVIDERRVHPSLRRITCRKSCPSPKCGAMFQPCAALNRASAERAPGRDGGGERKPARLADTMHGAEGKIGTADALQDQRREIAAHRLEDKFRSDAATRLAHGPDEHGPDGDDRHRCVVHWPARF